MVASGEWNAEVYRTVEVESVPSEVVPGYWCYAGEFVPSTNPDPDGDRDAMLVDLEYRLTLIELGLFFERRAHMLYRTLQRMIERGQTDGIEEKTDIFFAADKLTEAEYLELIAMLNA